MKNFTDPIEFARILQAYVKGELSISRQKEIETILKNSPELTRLAEELQCPEKINRELNIMASFDTEKALVRVHAAKHHRLRKIYITWLRVAVAVVLLMSATLFFLQRVDTIRTVNIPVAGAVVPGQMKARLLAASGEIYLLDSLTMISNENSVFKNEKGMLSVFAPMSLHAAEKQMVNHVIDVPAGGMYTLKLQDGTKVYLNSGSQLTFPPQFILSERRVKLSGEAYFEVTQNEKQPFVVEVEGMDVRVLGTSFNVKSYPDEAVIYTTLLTGKVMVTPENGTSQSIVPGEQACLDKKNGLLSVHPVEVGLYTAWKEGQFYFKDLPLEEVLKMLERWYDLRVFYVNSEVKTMVYSGKMKMYSSVEDVLRKFEKSGDVHFELKDRVLSVYEK